MILCALRTRWFLAYFCYRDGNGNVYIRSRMVTKDILAFSIFITDLVPLEICCCGDDQEWVPEKMKK